MGRDLRLPQGRHGRSIVTRGPRASPNSVRRAAIVTCRSLLGADTSRRAVIVTRRSLLSTDTSRRVAIATCRSLSRADTERRVAIMTSRSLIGTDTGAVALATCRFATESKLVRDRLSDSPSFFEMPLHCAGLDRKPLAANAKRALSPVPSPLFLPVRHHAVLSNAALLCLTWPLGFRHLCHAELSAGRSGRWSVSPASASVLF